MRILLVGRHHASEIRGATVVTHGLARTLRDRGHQVTLVHSARPEHRMTIEGIEMRYYGSTRKSLYPLLYGLASTRAFDVIHANDESGAYFAQRSRLSSLPMVAHLHPPKVKTEGFWSAGWRWRYIGMAARHAPMVLTPSRWLADALAERYRREPGDFHAIPNGIGDHWFASRREADSSAGSQPRVVLVNMKGVEIALRAFAKLVPEHEAHLELYGSHKDEGIYRVIAGELGLAGRVHFCGFVPNRELPGRIAGADILLHPTRSESFGQVLGEAAALGLPSISTRVNAVPEVVEDGKTGVLCAVDDADAMARALENLLSNPTLRRELGEAARERAGRLWRWNAVVERIEREIYSPLTSR